jgi:hypothetical protein
MRDRITARSSCPCFRPRPPRSPGLFFEEEQRGSLGQSLVLALELALELANATSVATLTSLTLILEASESLFSPRAKLRLVDPVSSKELSELCCRNRRRLEHQLELLCRSPGLGLSVVVA